MGCDEEPSGSVPPLTPAEYALVMAKNAANRLGFALLLVFYREHGRFPPSLAEIDPGLRAQVAHQLGLEPTWPDRYDPLQRTWKRARAEIRALFGFREATVADADNLTSWLCDQLIGAIGSEIAPLIERLEGVVSPNPRKFRET